MVFGPGLSVLVGENDSEKSAVIDAIRLCLTSSADYFRVTADDIPCGPVTGEKVIRRNHLGDSGTQFGMFI
ncbi:hypothetical protein [Saccharothrix sp. ST-888]|uniref:hypothetical protein n=1 Tax=Saccharothrix sp. ST-888 TaxID=1427391 RepID=UPI0012E0B407|nr:hypothetical protein [Saccharothrix sp. ST-888]